MTGSQGVRPELVEAARDALVRRHHEDFRAAYSRLGVTSLPFEELSERTVQLRHQQLDASADAVLAAVLPLLTPEDVPHIEAAVRAKVADVDLIRRAICDPGQFLLRGDNYQESIGSWSARAVVAAIARGGQDGAR